MVDSSGQTVAVVDPPAILRRAQQAGQNPNEYVQHMVEHNHLPELVSEVRRGKALASIVESAVVTDESGNHVELANLRPDGTIGEPEEESSEVDAEGTADVEADDSVETKA